MKFLSKAISVLFHPIFYFTYVFVALLFYSDEFLPYKHTYNLYLIVGYSVLNTIVIPLLLVYFINKDFQLREVKDRQRPIIIVGAMYLVVYFFFQRFLFPPILMKYLLGISIGLFFTVLMNRYLKISLHTTGIGAVLMLFFALCIHDSGQYFYYLLAVIIISGLVGSARLQLGEHSVKEVVLGYLLGVVSVGMLFVL